MSFDSKNIITLSNFLTLSRVFLTPFIVYNIVLHYWVWAFILFFIAAITDLLDGFCARLLKERTLLGAALDPIADKILLLATFSAFMFAKLPKMVLPFWFLFFVLFRELVIICGSLIIVFVKGNLQIKPTLFGKLTTFFQIIFILWYMGCSFFGWVPMKTYYLVLSGVTIFSTYSLINYVEIGIKFLRQKK